MFNPLHSLEAQRKSASCSEPTNPVAVAQWILEDCRKSCNHEDQTPRVVMGRDGNYNAVWVNHDGLPFQTRLSVAYISRSDSKGSKKGQRDRDESGDKVIKYLTPAAGEKASRLFMPKIGEGVAREIETEHGLEAGTVPTEGFWAWFAANPEIPLCITEGAKKGSAMLAQGKVTVAVAGVFNAAPYVKDESGEKAQEKRPQLISEFDGLGLAGRTVKIYFDSDDKESTRKNVQIAVQNLAAGLVDAGAKLVKSVSWDPKKAKGIDDLIATGEGWDKAFKELTHTYSVADLLAEREMAPKRAYAIEQDRKVRENLTGLNAPVVADGETTGKEYIDEDLAALISLRIFENTGTVSGVDAGMGSGKTSTFIRILIKEFTKRHPNGLFVYIAPRVALIEAACKTLGLTNYADPNAAALKSATKIGVTMESLHRLNHFHAQTEEASTRKVLVVCDEWSQLYSQMLCGATGDQTPKQQLATFNSALDAIKERGNLVLTEDLITEQDVNCTGLKRGYFHRFTRKTTGRDFIQVKSNHEIISALTNGLNDGKNCVAVSDSKTKLDQMHLALLEGGTLVKEQMLSITQDTNGDVKTAFFANPIGYVKANKIRLVLMSPTAQTGVSIDDEACLEDNPYFAIQTLQITHFGFRAARQMVQRLRSTTATTYFLVPKNNGEHRNGVDSRSYDPGNLADQLAENLKGIAKNADLTPEERANLNGQLNLSVEDQDVADRQNMSKALDSFGKVDLDRAFISDLKAKGHNVFKGKVQIDNDAKQHLEEAIPKFDDENQIQTPGGVLAQEARERAAADISDMTYETAELILNDQASKSADRIVAQKFKYSVQYPKTAATKAFDREVPQMILGQRGYFNKARIHLLVANPALRQDHHDMAAARLTSKVGSGDEFRDVLNLHRVDLDPQRAELLAGLGLAPFMNGDVIKWSKDVPCEFVEKVKTLALDSKTDIYRLLRLQIKPSQTGVEIVNKLLRKMGIRVTSDRYRTEGVRNYWHSLETSLSKEFMDAARAEAENPAKSVIEDQWVPSPFQIMNPMAARLLKLVHADMLANHVEEYKRVMFTKEHREMIDTQIAEENERRYAQNRTPFTATIEFLRSHRDAIRGARGTRE